MGLFGSKKGKNCPVCGGAYKGGFLDDSVKVADGIICGGCAEKLREEFPVKDSVVYSGGQKRAVGNDPLSGFTVAYIMERLADSGGTR